MFKFLVFLAIFVGILFVWLFFRGKCPKCGRTHAIKKTGREGREKGFFQSDKEEWKCKYCGHLFWKSKPADDYGHGHGHGGGGGDE